MKNPNAREDKAKRGQELVLKEHTFAKRVEIIIKNMESMR